MSDHREQIDHEEEQAARLTASALGELSETDQKQVESAWSEIQREEFDEIKRVSAALSNARHIAPLPEPSARLREAVESKLSSEADKVELSKPVSGRSSRGRWVAVLSTGLLLLLIAAAISNLPTRDLPHSIAMKSKIAELRQINEALRAEAKRADDRLTSLPAGYHVRLAEEARRSHAEEQFAEIGEDLRAEIRITQQDGVAKSLNVTNLDLKGRDQKESTLQLLVTPRVITERSAQEQLPIGSPMAVTKGLDGYTIVPPPATASTLQKDVQPNFTMPRYTTEGEVARGGKALGTPTVPAPNQLVAGPNSRGLTLEYALPPTQYRRQELTVTESKPVIRDEILDAAPVRIGLSENLAQAVAEQYAQIVENRFASVSDEPLSTFSIDVDTASYANTRRFLSQNQLPPANAIRIEEFINYFSYDYPAPKEGEPFSVNMEVADCPWQPAHQLVRIGLKGKDVPQEQRPASNIVFLLDVSGSMQNANKLPLLKQAMKLLTDQLTESDRVSIVTYAGNAGLALDTTNGESKQTIRDAIDALNANGSTNGSAGIQLAYEKATQSFIKAGANRVILATDGDLNVGVTNDDALVELIKAKAASGVCLTVLGFGEGNLKDGKLEKLADNGNGMYAYIDSLREARKVLVEQITGSLVTIAKDVKIKVEFNPAEVAAYRLLGYENRLMSAPDFENDAKDAGEIGAGHTVTALYEIVPSKAIQQLTSTTASLKYQRTLTPTEPPKELTAAAESGELLTLSLRYKQPDGDESTLSEFTVENKRHSFDDASTDFRFATAVASFAMVLRNSEFQGNSTLASVEEVASSAIGSDPQGHRTEFLDMVRKASTLQPPRR